MKNADMKVIAIILSIALLFTLFTTNAVSVASVVMLFVGGGSPVAGEQVSGDAGDTNNNTVAPQQQQSTQQQSTQQQNVQQQDPQKQDTPDTPDAPQQGADDPVIADPYAFFSKYANEIHEKGNAGYKKISWQAVEGELTLDKLQFLAGTLTDLIAGFMTTKEDASVAECAKGTDDAKHKMPVSKCDQKYIKSATAQKDGDNYVVTIVLAEFVNPSYDDPDGLQIMSREFLDIKDVVETVATDATVSKIVKSVDGTITYTDYTITATMTSDGKFIKIVHYGVGTIVADVEAVAGSLSASGALSFNAEYYDFVY